MNCKTCRWAGGVTAIMSATMLVCPPVFSKDRQASSKQNLEEQVEQNKNMIVTMAPTKQSLVDAKGMWHLEGYRVKDHKGIAIGVAVRTLGLGNEVRTLGNSLIGGRVGTVRKILDQTRHEAYNDMLSDARKQGANAVLWARYEDNPCGGFTEIVWYGNAVVVEPDTSEVK